MLVIDACEAVVEFLGASRDALALASVDRTWNVHVRRSRVWYDRVVSIAPITAAKHRNAEEYAVARSSGLGIGIGEDWLAVYVAAAVRMKQLALFTNLADIGAARSTVGWAGGLRRLTRFVSRAVSKPPTRLVLLVGLDAVGKSTLLHRLRLGNTALQPIPTIGFAVETLVLDGLRLFALDLPMPRRSVLLLWQHVFDDAAAIALVVDASNDATFDATLVELDLILAETTLPSDAPVVVLANKQDLPGAKTVEAVAAALDLPGRLGNRRPWAVFPTSSMTDAFSGTTAGLAWVRSVLDSEGNVTYDATQSR